MERHAPWWSYLGAVCGGGVGFIVANIPGLMLGAYAGNRLGAVRDAKGKSVAAVFSELGGNQKAEVSCDLMFYWNPADFCVSQDITRFGDEGARFCTLVYIHHVSYPTQ